MIRKITRRLLVFACMGFLSYQASAQSNAINTPAMSSMLPPAPNAYELTKYSGIPINLSTGAVTQTIPLGEIVQGKLKVPISLSYNGGNGVKVDQMASRAGVNWTMNAGGVVSRTVANKPDETSTWLSYPSGTPTSDALYSYLDNVTQANQLYDSEPDIFSFNFNGYSGQFILDPSNRHANVIHLAASPLKVETNFNNQFSADWSIRITDPEGTQYYFGGSSATEESKTVPEGGGCGKNYENYIPTAWYLTKIRHYAGDEINFSYSPITFDYYAAVSQTFIRTPQSTLLDFYNVSVSCPNKSETQICGSYLRSKGVVLTGINSKLQSVFFQYQTRPDSEGDGLFQSVGFYKADPTNTTGSHTLYKSYSLSYTYSNNNKQANSALTTTYLISRPFLTYVSGNEEYKMQYYNINGLPARLSFSQDYWGYYNDKINVNLIPRSNNADDALLFPNNMADRDPDGSKSYYGLLSSIFYPTGGRDSLIYEPNTIYESRVIMPPHVTTNITKQGTGYSTEQVETFYFNNSDTRATTLNLSTTYGTGLDDQIHQHTIFKLYAGSTLVLSQVVRVGQTYSTTLALANFTYRLEVHAFGEAAIGNAEITYQPQGNSVYANYEVGGVRLARNISYPLVGPPIQKKLVYASLATQTRSSGRLASKPFNGDYYADLPIHMGDDNKQCVYKAAYSNPKYPLNFFSGGHILYQDVIEVNDENWTNGGVVHHFIGGDGASASSVMGSTIQGAAMGNEGFAPGLETEAKTFIKTGGTAGSYTTAVVSEKKTHYKMDTRLELNTAAYSVRRKWNQSTVYTPKSLSDLLPFDAAQYTLKRQWIYPDTTITTVYDNNAANPVSTTQVTLYNQTGHLQPNEIRTTMSDGRTGKIKLKYPEEMVADGVTAPYSTMITQHRISPTIVKSRYIDDTLLESQTTSYAPFSGSIIEPQYQQYAQGANAPTSFVTLHDYNTAGRLLTQSQTNGAKTSYLYGYKGDRLIVECRNALPNEFYHQNFEEDGSVASGNAHTGSRYYNGDYALTWSPPNGRSYMVSYWYLDGSAWKMYRGSYTTPVTLSLGSAIDDVSIFPSDAEMETFTYDMAAGIASMIDEKGLTTYYEYDSRQRLSLIKDQNGDIVKKYTYNLTGPVVEVYNTVQSQIFTKACTTGTGTNVTYTVPAGTYSSTVSQADANNQALAEIAANGQAHANANGTCVTGNITISHTNVTSSSYISSLVIKDGSGNTLYTYNASQIAAGFTIPQGSYTFVFTISGNDWGSCYLSAGSYFGFLENTVASSYTLNNVNLTTSTGTLYLDFFF